MRSEKLQAFVLSALDYGDSDRIVSLFTLEHGHIRCFARSARTSRKRFGAGLEPFARIEGQVSLKDDGLAAIRQSDVQDLYPSIRADLQRIAHALHLCELIDLLTPEGLPLPRLFRLMNACLERFSLTTTLAQDLRFFEINLLNILGYRPSLNSCSRCAEPFGPQGGLLLGEGELLCRFCAATGREISEGTLLRLAACLSTGTFGRIIFPERELYEAGLLLDEALAAHAGRRLKSLEFLRQVTE